VIPELGEDGLTIRDYAASTNNCVPESPRLSATHMIDKAIFERFYLVPGHTPIYALCHHALFTHPPTAQPTTISGFSCNFNGPSIYRVILHSPAGTLLGSACSKVSFETHFFSFFGTFLDRQFPILKIRGKIEGLGGHTQSPAQP